MTDTAKQAVPETVCEYCGPRCYRGAEHNARVEDNARYTDAAESQPQQGCKPECAPLDGVHYHRGDCANLPSQPQQDAPTGKQTGDGSIWPKWCEEGDHPYFAISNGPTEYACIICHQIEELDQAEAALTLAREALMEIKALFVDPSPFYIKKLGLPMTDGDQAKIDVAFIKLDAALAATKEP